MKARVGHCGAVAKEGFLKLCIITLTRSDHCFGRLRNQPLILLVEKNSFVQFFSLEHDLGNLTSDEAPQRFINRCGVFHSVFSVYRRLQPTWAIPHRLLYTIFYWAQEMFFCGRNPSRNRIVNSWIGFKLSYSNSLAACRTLQFVGHHHHHHHHHHH